MNEIVKSYRDAGKHIIDMKLLQRANEIKEGEVIRLASGYVRGNAEKYHIPATFSDETVDRYGDVILAEAYNTSLNFERYFNANNVMLWGHNMDRNADTRPIGNIIEPTFTNKSFDGKADFRAASVYAFAEEIFNLYKIGTLKTFSVGFRPKTVSFDPIKEGQDGLTFLEVELLEVSAVPIPANPNALTKALKGGYLSQETLETQFAPFLKWCVGEKCYLIPKSVITPEEHLHKSVECECQTEKGETTVQAIKRIVDEIKTKKEVSTHATDYYCRFCGTTTNIKHVDPASTDEEKIAAKAAGVEVIEEYEDFLGEKQMNFSCPDCGFNSKETDEIALNF